MQPPASFIRQHSAILMFVAGFLFDFLTMQRIDAWLDLAFQLAYLGGLTALLVFHDRKWPYHVEVLHFLYGGLLSAYVVLYFRSSTFARPLIFLVLLVTVMVVNEVPRVRSAGHRLRLGIYALCVLSFLAYFIPILVGRMGGWVFLLSLIVSGAIVWVVTRFLTEPGPERRRARLRLFAPAAGVLAAIAVLYALRLIPPVPLSVQFQGIYHRVERDARGYALTYDPPAWAPWRRDSRPFERRSGDRVYYFARVFAPTGFSHRVLIRWEVYDERREQWLTTDRIPFNVVGGRAEGFRGWAVKANIAPGRWRVTAETDDGRAIGTISFTVQDDEETGERAWKSLRA
jgi:hypothetical protein